MVATGPEVVAAVADCDEIVTVGHAVESVRAVGSELHTPHLHLGVGYRAVPDGVVVAVDDRIGSPAHGAGDTRRYLCGRRTVRCCEERKLRNDEQTDQQPKSSHRVS